MALMKWDPSVKKERWELSLSEDGTKSNLSESTYFSNLNPFSQFHCRRIIVQNSRGDEPVVTRIEEAVFTCNPPTPSNKQYNFLNGQSLDQIIQPDNFEKQSLSKRKHSHSKKHKSDHKSLKKDSKPNRKQNKNNKGLYQKIILAVILVCPFLLWWLSTQYRCQVIPLDFGNLETSLKHEVVGQEEALNFLLLNFYRTSNLKSQPPVFLLCGSTGVGKSFVVDLVLEHFPGLGHKELLFYPTPAPESVVKNLKECEHNVLVIDSLNFKDSEEIASWTERLQKEAVNQQKLVWLLMAFTTEHWTSDTTFTPRDEFLQEIAIFSNKIEDVFRGHGISSQLVTFKPMELHHVKECIQKELEKLNLLADETQLDQIVDKLTATPSLRVKGCKHVKKFFLHSDNFRGLAQAVD